jgi:hypothetical protein
MPNELKRMIDTESNLGSGDMEKFFEEMQESNHPFADLTDSFVFEKIVFSKEENKDILLRFLNVFLIKDRDLEFYMMLGVRPLELPLTNITLLPPNPLPSGVKDPRTSVCSRWRDDLGNRFLFELDNYPYSCEGYFQRTQLDANKDRDQYIWGGTGNTLLISIVNSNRILFEKNPSYITYAHLKSIHNNEIFTYYKPHVIVELKKFQMTRSEVGDQRDFMVYVLKNSSKLTPEDLDAMFGDEPVFRKLFQALEVSNWTSEEREAYYRSQQARASHMKSIIEMEDTNQPVDDDDDDSNQPRGN